MRVLALGALDVPYIRDNWSDALRHVLGADVTQVNVSAWLACGAPEAHMKAVYRLLATGTYDYLFLYHDYIFADFPDEFFAHVRSAGVRTVAYHPDDEPEVWYRRNAAFDARYDVVASHARRGVNRRKDEQRPTHAVYVPWGFNHRFFHRPDRPGSVTARHDVVFIGKYKADENDRSRFREDGQRRDEALHAVAALCAARGWRFALFGHGWERHATLAPHAGGLLSHEAMIRTFHESRIVLNPGWTADEGAPHPQTKLRHFEVPGCGAFQLTNENPELAELFERDREIVFYRDNHDLCEQIEYYLSNEGERAGIAAAGYARAHAEHTLDRRVTTLFDEARRIAPPRHSHRQPRPAPAVRTVPIRSSDELRALREEVASASGQWASADAVHLLAADAVTASTDYGALRDWWRADVGVFAGRTFYRSTARAKNPLQPQRSELVGGFLGEATSLAAIPLFHRDQVLEQSVSVADEQRGWFLIDYIVRPHMLLPLIDAFLSGDVRRVEALEPLETGVVFSEVTLSLPPQPDSGSDGSAVPAYMGPLRSVLRQAAALGQRVAMYGARGDMAESVLSELKKHDLELVGLFDRAMAGSRLAGIPVYSAFDLPQVKPDVLIIAAAYSGQAIYEQLKPLEAQITLVPLHDLNAPAWSVLVAA